MEENRYTLTLEDVPAEIIGIQQVGVPYGLNQSHIEAGYILKDGTILLEGEKDTEGFYVGEMFMEGRYLKTIHLYEPVRNGRGKVTAFRHMSPHLTYFTGAEQEVIFQYGLNTKENLIHDLESVVQAVKHPAIRALFSSTLERLKPIPSEDCRRLMADIRAVYKDRHEQTIQQRQRAAAKTRKNHMER